MLFAGLIGLLIGALVIGGVWLASGSTAAGVGTQSITIPQSIGEFVPFEQVDLNKSAKATDNVARVESWDEQSTLRLSKASGGAAAAVRSYSDKDLRNQISVLVYRATASPNPQFVPYQDANTLGLVHPPEEMEQFSGVSCVLHNDPTPVGTNANPNSVHTINCVRTGPELTVEIRPTGDISNEPQRVAQLVDEVWNSLA
jgi:hypothetical protein